MNLAWIKTRIHKGEYEVSSHAEEERQADKISMIEIENAILNGEVLENYALPKWIDAKTRRR